MRLTIGISCLWLAGAMALWSQDATTGLRKESQETNDILSQAKTNGAADTALRDAQGAANQGRVETLAAQGTADESQIKTLAELQVTEAAQKRLELALNEISPEDRELLAQNTPPPRSTVAEAPATGLAGATRAPDPDASPAPALGRAPDPDAAPTVRRAGDPDAPTVGRAADPDAVPLTRVAPKVNKNAPPAPDATHVIVTCEGAGYFDSSLAMAVFTENVDMHHPQFHLICDQMEVYMLKDDEKPKVTQQPAVGPDGKPLPHADNSIKQAIATGRRVIIEKDAETGESQIAICRHATYVGANGDCYLRDNPQVQRGNSLNRATSPATYMIIKQDGRLFTYGPHVVDIIQDPKKKDAPGQPAAAAAVAAPAGAQSKPPRALAP